MTGTQVGRPERATLPERVSRWLLFRWRSSRALRIAALLTVVVGVAGWLALTGLVIATTLRLERRAEGSDLLREGGASSFYARPLELRPGTPVTAADLGLYFRDLGYLASTAEESRQECRDERPSLPVNRYLLASPPAGAEGDETDLVRLCFRARTDPAGDGAPAGSDVVIALAPADEEKGSARIHRILVDGERQEQVVLEAVELGLYLPETRIERRWHPLEALPEHFTLAVLAAEDRAFRRHEGVSWRGTARAAWVNLRAGAVRQGGSTITQQVARLLSLTQERTLERKIREALLAVQLDQTLSKDRLLEIYLNGIYLGSREGRQLVGVGAASRAFFGKSATDLDLAEAATLAGMISAPGRFLPDRAPDAARARRDWVLRQMAALGWASEEETATALATPIEVRPARERAVDARFARRRAAIEAHQRFDIDGLEEGAYRVESTLDWLDQLHAERTLTSELERLRERRPQLEGALLSIHPESGAVRAYVGGEDFDRSEFDRVYESRRQIGSLFKPVVYAAAIGSGTHVPASPIWDLPLVVRYTEGGAKSWRPRNDANDFHGLVTMRRAAELSLNSATVRVGLETGLDEVARMAQSLGLPVDDAPLPSVLLGAEEASPWQIGGVYATLAAGGVRSPLHLVDAVARRYEAAEEAEEASTPSAASSRPDSRRVLDADTAFLVTSMLQGVLTQGTGWSARREGLDDPLAGKTGTSDQARDSWFAGYAPDRATVAWIGRDDGEPMGLSGHRGALPVWTELMKRVRPAGGFSRFDRPESVIAVRVVENRLVRLPSDCDRGVVELFPRQRVPEESWSCDRTEALAGLERGLAAAVLGPLPSGDDGIGERQPLWLEVIRLGEDGEIVERDFRPRAALDS